MTAEEAKKEKCLWVAISEDGKEVVINQIAPPMDADGWSHLVFSPQQARHLAGLLFRKANIVDGFVCGHCGDRITQEGGWALALFRYCFKQECQEEFYKEAQAMIRKVNPETADLLAAATGGSRTRHHVQTLQKATFTCPKCSAVSYNPNDVENRYCGACHLFFGDLEIGLHL